MNKKRQIVESILRLADKFKQIWEKEFLKKYNITPLQFNILWVVLEENAKTIQDIKQKLIVSSASLSQTLNRMEDKKLIERVYGNQDKRYVNIKVPQEWKKLYYKLRDLYENLIDEKLKNIKDEEKLLEMLEGIEKITDLTK